MKNSRFLQAFTLLCLLRSNWSYYPSSVVTFIKRCDSFQWWLWSWMFNSEVLYSTQGVRAGSLHSACTPQGKLTCLTWVFEFCYAARWLEVTSLKLILNLSPIFPLSTQVTLLKLSLVFFCPFKTAFFSALSLWQHQFSLLHDQYCNSLPV